MTTTRKKGNAALSVDKGLKFSLLKELIALQASVSTTAQQAVPKKRRGSAKSEGQVEEYVLLPERGTRAAAATATHDFLTELFDSTSMKLSAAIAESTVSSTAGFGLASVQGNVRMIDSIAENGAKLVEMTAADRIALKTLQPNLRIVPVVYYKPQLFKLFGPENPPPTGNSASSTRTVTVRVIDTSGNPVRGALVTAFTHLASKTGVEGKTSASGTVSFQVKKTIPVFELILARSDVGFWGTFQKGAAISTAMSLVVEPINLSAIDCVRHFMGVSPVNAGSQVVVGVVDTGVGPHPDLMVAAGENTVAGEQPGDFQDNGLMHGTHVAGIIASRGHAPAGLGGVAPGVTLHSYRVFARNVDRAKSFHIAKAIDAASLAGCHLINLSLGGGPADPLVSDSIEEARERGSLCIIAAGNDNRSSVAFPAHDPNAVSVSALGRTGTFPSGSIQVLTNLRPPSGTDPANFIASFSNFGPEIDVAGPGVGVVSTVIGGYGVLDGTSMACPAVTGALARRLGAKPAVLALNGAQRSTAMLQELLLAAQDLGFPTNFQGRGLPT